MVHKLIILTIIFFFNLPIFSQDGNKEKEELNKKLQKLEEEIKQERSRLDQAQNDIERLKQEKSEGKLSDSKTTYNKSYVSSMKEKGLSGDMSKTMFLDPEHGKEFKNGKKLWLNDYIRLGVFTRPRLEARQNLDFNSTTDDYANRALGSTQVFFIVDPNPYVSFKFTIQDARVWGGQKAASSGDRKYFFSNSGTTFDPTQKYQTASPNNTDVREAFFILKHPDLPVRLIMGRQVFSFGDQRMLGGANWNSNGQSFDGVRFVYESKRFDSHLFGSKITASASAPNGVITSNGRKNGSIDDSYLAGNYNTIKFEHFLIDLYAIGIFKKWIPNTPAYTGEVLANDDVLSYNRSRQNDNLLTGGFRITNRTEGNFLPKSKSWDWTIESAFQGGFTGQRHYASWDMLKDSSGKSLYTERKKYTGYMYVIQTGYTFFEKLRFGLQYSFSSGDRNRTDGSVSTFQLMPNPRFAIYPYFNSVMGLAENIGLKNVKSYNLNVSYKTNKWGEFVLSGFIHKKARREDAWYHISGDAKTGNSGSCSVSTNPTASSTESCDGNVYSITAPLGSGLYNEIDISWAYHLFEGVSIWMGAGYLKAGDSIRNARTDILNTNPYKRYTFNPNAYISYFMVNVAF